VVAQGLNQVSHRPAQHKKYPDHHSRIGLIALALVLCLTLSANVVNAQDQPNASHSYTYGQRVTFNLSIDDASAYGSYTLYISALDMNVSSYSVKPTNNSIVFERNLREQPLPPFSLVTYWWEYSDLNKTLITTEKTTFQYIDNRYAWQTYTDKGFSIYWVSGEKAMLMNATTIAWETLTKMQHALQTPTTPTVDVYIYPSTLDLQSALQLAGHEWIAGAAYPELGVILLSVTDGSQALSQMQRDLPHELTHKILFDIYGAEGYHYIPAWLDEGLASHFELNPDPAYALALENANANSSILRLETLCHPFPDDHRIALLSYAQSESMTSYIQQKYGWSSIRSLLQLYTEDGVDCTSGLEEILGLPTIQFEREWRVWLETQSQDAENPDGSPEHILQLTPKLRAAISIFINDAARWLVLCALLVAPFMIFSLKLIIKKSTPK